MKARNVPKKLWSYCAKWSCDVCNRTASNSFALEGRTPYEAIYGTTPYISALCELTFMSPFGSMSQMIFQQTGEY
jgi:hypothetical protein